MFRGMGMPMKKPARNRHIPNEVRWEDTPDSITDVQKMAVRTKVAVTALP